MDRQPLLSLSRTVTALTAAFQETLSGSKVLASEEEADGSYHFFGP